MNINDLLELADHLATREARRPKQASLRRAVSSAYYALFHGLAALCAEALVGWSKPWAVFTPVYRSLDHGSAKRLFERDREGKVLGADVAKIGRVFASLQQARYIADYDPEPFPYGRQETQELIDQARQAVVSIGRLSPETRLKLAVGLIVKQR
jgi:hypothetical protein